MNACDNEKFRGRQCGAFKFAVALTCAATMLGLAACDKRPAPNTSATVAPPSPQPVSVRAAFDRECETMLLAEIDKAEKEILVAIFNITRRNITGALVRAARRGVKVHVKYDAMRRDGGEGTKSSVDYLARHGVKCTPIRMADERANMHNKFTVIDGRRVLTGSFNYTTTASTMNYENTVLIESEDIARRYADEFERIGNSRDTSAGE